MEKWRHNIGTVKTISEIAGKKHLKVCSDHFHENCFQEDNMAKMLGYTPKKSLLKDGANGHVVRKNRQPVSLALTVKFPEKNRQPVALALIVSFRAKNGQPVHLALIVWSGIELGSQLL